MVTSYLCARLHVAQPASSPPPRVVPTNSPATQTASHIIRETTAPHHGSRVSIRWYAGPSTDLTGRFKGFGALPIFRTWVPVGKVLPHGFETSAPPLHPARGVSDQGQRQTKSYPVKPPQNAGFLLEICRGSHSRRLWQPILVSIGFIPLGGQVPRNGQPATNPRTASQTECVSAIECCGIQLGEFRRWPCSFIAK